MRYYLTVLFVFLFTLNFTPYSYSAQNCANSLMDTLKARAKTIRSYKQYLTTQDFNKGNGLQAADVYVFDKDKPVIKAKIKMNDIPRENKEKQIVWFGSSDAKKLGSNGVGVRGIPTRVYLNPKNGEIAYINFDGQALQLVESFNFYPKNPIFKVIENWENGLKQDEIRHPGGFSSPVGPLKNGIHISDLTIEQARKLIGIEGSEVTLEYDSGVVVTGTIESYTEGQYSYNPKIKKVAVITLKDQTARVKFGVHTLYMPEWGAFDMLVSPDLVISGQLTNE